MNPHLACQTAIQSWNMSFNQQYTVLRTLFVYWHTQSNSPRCEWVTEWQKVRDIIIFLCLFQIHSRETLTKSISLPRSAYWQHITRQNSVGDLYSYQGTGTKLLIITCFFLYLLVSVVMCGALRRGDAKTKTEGMLHPATEGLSLYIAANVCRYSSQESVRVHTKCTQ